VGLIRLLAFTWIGRAIVGLVAIAVVGGTVIAPRFAASAPTVAVRTATVARGNVAQTVTVSGSVNAAGTVKLSFGTAGRLLETLVKVGDNVAKDQPLARLDTTDLQTTVRQQEANLASAQAKYDATLAGATAEDIALSRNSVDQAQKSYQTTQKTTQNDLTAAQQALDNAKASLTQTQKTTANDIASALASFNKAKTSYSSARANFASLATAIRTDAGTYRDGLAGARSAISTTISDLDAVSHTNDVTSARNSVLAADLSLSTAQTYVNGTLQSVLDEYLSAVADIVGAAHAFDGAATASVDTSDAVSKYQIAQVAYSLTATKLSSAIDVPVAQVTSAGTSIAAAQSSMSSNTSRPDAIFNGVRADLAGLQTSVTAEGQLSTLIKAKLTQAATSVSTIGDAVNGSYVSAQQAYTSALTKADTSVTSAQNAVTSAQQSYDSAKVKAESSLSSSENAVTTAQLNFSKTTATARQTDIAASYASLLGAQVALDKAKNDLANATLKAPSASVVASIANQPGEFVSANTAAGFIVLALTATLTLHGTVGEADVAKLKLGQVATATVEAIGSGTRLTGRVTSLDPVATIQQGVPVYGIDVQIDIPDPAIRAGMSGTATVIISNRQGILTVPNLAIRSQNGLRASPAQSAGRSGCGSRGWGR